jgi:flagella basal body P-ring formation protein FlgA
VSLESGDIEWVERTRWGPPDTTRAPVEPGWEVRRGVRAGELLVGVVVAPPKAVGPGEPLRIFWQRGGLEIELEAVALTGGRVGERVQARTETGRVTARMTAVGVARIEGGVP